MRSLSPEQKWSIKQMLFAEVLRELDMHFTKLGVEWMPIKGVYLIMAGLAEKIPAREMVDVDILVREEDFEKTYLTLSALPGKKIAPTSWPLAKAEYDYEVAIDGVWGTVTCTVEIHRALGYAYQFNVPNRFLFDNSVAIDGYCRLPRPETALLIALCHQIVNIAHRANPTLAADAAVITGMREFSMERFWQMADATNTRSIMYYLLCAFVPGTAKHATSCISLRGRYLDLLKHIPANNIYSFPKPLRRILVECAVVRKPLLMFAQGLGRSFTRMKAKGTPQYSAAPP